jgi:hypothetical protein
MVTDCLTPVIAEEGVGTIVTLNERKVLGNGLEFNQIQIETFELSEPHWDLKVIYPLSKHHRDVRLLWLTGDTFLFTADGWLSIPAIAAKVNSYKTVYVRGLFCKCIVCQSPFQLKKPVWTVCGKNCVQYSKQNNLLRFRPLNANTVLNCLSEEWIQVGSSWKFTTIPSGIQSVRLKDIVGGDSIYANNILISSKNIIERV